MTAIQINKKYLESFELWWWGMMEKISWTGRVKNEEVLRQVKEKWNTIHRVKRLTGLVTSSVGAAF
jgi:hypothetical protein